MANPIEKKIYYVGICPKNLNQNHKAWAHSVESFSSAFERNEKANEYDVLVEDTCDRVLVWEE